MVLGWRSWRSSAEAWTGPGPDRGAEASWADGRSSLLSLPVPDSYLKSLAAPSEAKLVFTQVRSTNLDPNLPKGFTRLAVSG